MTSVYLVQRPMMRDISTGEFIDKYDLSACQRYGDLRVCLMPGNVRADRNNWVHSLARSLKGFTSEDYLLTLGDPVAIATAAIIAAKNSGGLIRLLKWDKHRTDYLPVVLDLRTFNAT